jgi:lambda repressor-like predicted transcriptional regulator
MTRPCQPRYPFDDLRDVVDPAHERTNLEVAEALGLHPRQLERYRRQGVTDCAADRLAVRAGTHPAVIWPEWCHAVVGAA